MKLQASSNVNPPASKDSPRKGVVAHMLQSPRFGEAVKFLAENLAAGKLKSRETVMEGFEHMPDALMALFSGDNIGKQLVHVAD